MFKDNDDAQDPSAAAEDANGGAQDAMNVQRYGFEVPFRFFCSCLKKVHSGGIPCAHELTVRQYRMMEDGKLVRPPPPCNPRTHALGQ